MIAEQHMARGILSWTRYVCAQNNIYIGNNPTYVSLVLDYSHVRRIGTYPRYSI